MSPSSLPPSSGDDVPIDAEFEPAKPKPKTAKSKGNGPGWPAFGLVGGIALVSLGMASFSAGLIPGLKPGAGEIKTVKTELSALRNQANTSASTVGTLETALNEQKARGDSLRADHSRTATGVRAIQDEIETLQADISALQRARVASLAESGEEAESVVVSPDLTALESRITALEDAMVTQLGDFETRLDALRLQLDELEDQAQTDSLSAATQSNNRTEAALALSAIEAAARRGRPFLTGYQRLSGAMPSNDAVQSLEPIATKAVPTLSDLRATFPALMDLALDQEAEYTPGASGWMRSLFGDGVQVRQKGAVTARDHLNRAYAALEARELSESIEHIRAIDSNLQPVFTDWLQNAEDRHLLEETLEALRLTMIAEERP